MPQGPHNSVLKWRRIWRRRKKSCKRRRRRMSRRTQAERQTHNLPPQKKKKYTDRQANSTGVENGENETKR